MSWSSLGSALPVVLVDRDNALLSDPIIISGDTYISSTSSLVIDDGTGFRFIRCFGVKSTGMVDDAKDAVLVAYPLSFTERDAWTAYAPDPPGLAEEAACTVFTDATKWIEYVDSDFLGSRSITGARSGTIEIVAVAETANADGSTNPAVRPVKPTCVPYFRKDQVLVAEKVTAYGLTGSTLAVHGGTFNVKCHDPCVIRVATDTHYGYLMLTVRSIQEALSDDETPEDKGQVLTEIVGWWSTTPEFTDPEGPILLVHGLDALPDQDANLRFWLGVPGAAITGSPKGADALYIYYVFHAARPALKSDASGADFWDARAEDASPWETYAGATKRWKTTQGDFEQGIGVKRIYLQGLLDAIDAGSTHASRQETSWSHSDAVAGELLGMVRLWVATGEPSFQHEVRPFYQVFPWAQAVDPMALVCDDRLSLYYAANIARGAGSNRGARVGHGIWRSMAFPEHLELTNVASPADTTYFADPFAGTVQAIFGRDFVVRAPEGGLDISRPYTSSSSAHPGSIPGYSPDLIVRSTFTTIYVDPDVFIRDQYTVVLYVGAVDSTLSAFKAPFDDACLSYADAFVHDFDTDAEQWVVPPLGRRPHMPATLIVEAPWPNRLKTRGTAAITSPPSETIGFQSRLGTRCGCGAKDRGEQG